MKTIKLRIDGMHCVSCGLNIDGELEDTPGVFSSSTSYKHQICEIEYDPSNVSEEQLKAIISKLGYSVA